MANQYPCIDNLIELAEMAKDADFLIRDVTGDGKPETFCNFFVNDVAKGMGCEDFQGLMANEIVGLLEHSPDDWTPLEQDWATAQKWVNEGYLIVYGAKAKGHGHVCVGVPGELTESRAWKCKVPMVANVGAKNFTNKPLSFAWGADKKSTVKAWAWKGPKEVEEMPPKQVQISDVLQPENTPALNLPPVPAGAKPGKESTEFKIAWHVLVGGGVLVGLGIASTVVPVLGPLASLGLIEKGSELALSSLGIYGGARVLSKGISDVTAAMAAKKQ